MGDLKVHGGRRRAKKKKGGNREERKWEEVRGDIQKDGQGERGNKLR